STTSSSRAQRRQPATSLRTPPNRSSRRRSSARDGQPSHRCSRQAAPSRPQQPQPISSRDNGVADLGETEPPAEPVRYAFASTGETDTATRAIRAAETAGPIRAENLAAFVGAIVRVENV